MKKDNGKKLVVLMLSQAFLMGHSKAGKPNYFVQQLTNALRGYSEHEIQLPDGSSIIVRGKKLHTIRENYEYWKEKTAKINAGEMELSIRVWSGKPYKSQQVEVARLSHVSIQLVEMSYSVEDSQPIVYVDNVLKPNIAEEMAKNDGLQLEDWTEWFFKKTNTFRGVILHFTDFKY